MKDKLIAERFEELERKALDMSDNMILGFRDEGIDYYKVDRFEFTAWSINVLNLFQRVFDENSIHYEIFRERYDSVKNSDVYSDSFGVCEAIFRAAKEDYEGGYLFNVRTLVKAETLVDVLEQAETLKNAGYFDPACIMAGVALEIAIKEICVQEGCTIGSFNAMNEALRKKGVYNQAMWEQLKAWYTRRSDPAHGNFNQSSPQDTDDMLKGVKRFIADYL